MPLMSRGSRAAVRRGSGAVAGREPGRASWYPEAAIPATLARLDAVGALVPEELAGPVCAASPDGPDGPGGAQLAAQGSGARGRVARQRGAERPRTAVTLIDWETGGLGLPVLDLGSCLIESLLDAQPSGGVWAGAGPRVVGPAAWLVEPDEDRIAAVAAGYASQRVVGAAERALLPAAVRFGACYVGAIHLYQALAEGVRGASMDARLERLRNRVSVSEAVARLAAPHLAGGAETVR